MTTPSMRPTRLAAAVFLLAATMVAIAAWRSADDPQAARPTESADAYAQSVNDWRARREARLRADDGWLTLVGLHWLREGPNTVGGRPNADVPLPEGSAPPDVGTIELTSGVASFRPAPMAGIRINGAPARPQPLRPQPGDHDVVTTGSVTFFVIKRGDRYGVRVRDAVSPARRNFAGLHWYPVREHYRVTAAFVPHQSPTSIMIANVLGAVEPWPTPGKVVFTLDGREFTLHPVLDGDDARELFFIFRDATSGSDTYGGGRFLYAEMPANGKVVLDFNKAESPPCAYTPFATCPLPPKENALPIRIEAGEMNPHR